MFMKITETVTQNKWCMTPKKETFYCKKKLVFCGGFCFFLCNRIVTKKRGVCHFLYLPKRDTRPPKNVDTVPKLKRLDVWEDSSKLQADDLLLTSSTSPSLSDEADDRRTIYLYWNQQAIALCHRYTHIVTLKMWNKPYVLLWHRYTHIATLKFWNKQSMAFWHRYTHITILKIWSK